MSDPDFPPEVGATTGCARAFCRAVCRYFQRRSTDVATIEELATAICENSQLNEDKREVVIQLHHATLPRLATVGLIDYDARTNTARYRGETNVDEPEALHTEGDEMAEWSW